MNLKSLENQPPKKTVINDLFGRPVQTGKKRKNSKKEGNKNERAAAAFVSKWTGERFIRTPSSGGRRLLNNSSFCGDIVCENENFNFLFCVETKHLNDVSIKEKLVIKSKVYTIWDQALADAQRANKLPMVLLRKVGMNKQNFVVFFDKKVADYLLLQGLSPSSTGLGRYELYGFEAKDILQINYEKFATFLKKFHYI